MASTDGQANITYLVHGEEDSMRIIAEKLTATKVEMPDLHQVYTL